MTQCRRPNHRTCRIGLTQKSVLFRLSYLFVILVTTTNVSADGLSVEKGESLSVILQRAKIKFKETKKFIYGKNGLIAQTLRLNPSIKNPDLIHSGMTIILPTIGSRLERPIQVSEIISDESPTTQSPVETPKPPETSAQIPAIIPKPVPSRVERSTVNSIRTPHFFRLYLGVGLNYGQYKETVRSQETTTGNLWSIPSLEVRGEYRWLNRLSLGASVNYLKTKSVLDLSFPAIWNYELSAYARNVARPFAQALDLGFEYSRVGQVGATPNIANFQSTGELSYFYRELELRSAQIFTRFGWCMTAYCRGRIRELSIGYGPILSSSARSPGTLENWTGGKGWAFTTRYKASLIEVFGRSTFLTIEYQSHSWKLNTFDSSFSSQNFKGLLSMSVF